MKKLKIGICLIHNNEAERLKKILPNITKLKKTLESKKYEVLMHESSWQPTLEPVSRFIGIYRDWLYWKLNREWNKYKMSPNRFFVYDSLRLLIKIINKNILKCPSRNWLKNCAIEMFVSNKHLKTFDWALENKADYLITLEDNAIFKKDSIKNIVKLLKKIREIPTYVDLAGGCDLKKLRIEKLMSEKSEGLIYYNKPVTNTACGYLVNKKQLKEFGNQIIKKPKLRYIGIDWLLNKIFILQNKRGLKSYCIHTSPPFIKHGSVTGEFKPWKR